MQLPGVGRCQPRAVHAEGTGGGRRKAKRLDIRFFGGKGQGGVLALSPVTESLAGETGLFERALPEAILKFSLQGKTGGKLAVLSCQLKAVVMQRPLELQSAQVYAGAAKLQLLSPNRGVENALGCEDSFRFYSHFLDAISACSDGTAHELEIDLRFFRLAGNVAMSIDFSSCTRPEFSQIAGIKLKCQVDGFSSFATDSQNGATAF